MDSALPPDQVLSGGPGLSYKGLETMPLADVLIKALHGSGECRQVMAVSRGLDHAGWTLIFLSLA
ncbi:MAG: hypothetical protein U1F55_06150 [Chitinivorax sp.]